MLLPLDEIAVIESLSDYTFSPEVANKPNYGGKCCCCC